MQQQVSSGRTATIIHILCIFAQLFGRIRIYYLAYYSDRKEYE